MMMIFNEHWQIFFGGVFDKRAGMLFAARRNEDGNVHRRDGVSKTVTKNMRVGFFFKNPKTKERPKEAPARGSTITADTAERSFPHLILKGIPGFLSVFFPRWKNISGLQPDDVKNNSFRPKYQPSCSEGKPESLPDGKAGLKENPFPSADVAPLTLQHADVFNELTTSPIGLTAPRILTADDGVKTPSTADVRTTCFDVQLLAVPARLLATFGRLVDVEVFSIKNFNLLITNFFCLKPVDKNDDDREIIFSHYPFFAETGESDHRKRCADLTRRVGFWPPRLFLLSPYQSQHRLPTTPIPCGIRTPNQTAARHPLGLLRVGRFGSIFFTPLSSRVGGVGLSKCKGKLNTIKKINKIVNLPLLLLGWGGQRLEKCKTTFLADFLFCGVGTALQKLVHPVGCVLLQWLAEGLDKKCDKIRGLHFFSFWTQKGWLLFFGVCF